MEPLRLDTIGGLAEDEGRALAAIQAEQEHLLRDELEAVRERYHEEQDAIEFEANGGQIPKSQLRSRRKKAAEAGKFLPLSVAIRLNSGSVATGAQIVSQPRKFEGLYCYTPFEESLGKSKARILIRRGPDRPVLRIFAHGEDADYEFADDRDLEDVMDMAVPEPSAPEPLLRDHRTGAVIFAASASAALSVQPPPPEVYRPVNYPVISIEEVPAEARAIVADASDGIRAVVGQSLEIAVAAEFFRTKQGTIFVRDYDAAADVRKWILSVKPDARIMVMPGRTVDAAKLRALHGAEFLSYRDDGGNVAGLADDVCMKRGAAKALHGIGLGTVAGMMCVKPPEGGMPAIRCQWIESCGKMRRLGARGHHDFVVETSAALAGQLNPLLEGEDKFSAETLLVDLADRPSAEPFEWDYSYWTREPLAQFLPWIELRRPDPPSFADVGKNAKAELLDWAGSPAVRPDMTDEASTDAVKRWRAATSGAEDRRVPTRIETANAIEAWIAGNARLRVDADKVVALVNTPPRRLVDTQALVLTTSKASRDNMLARMRPTEASLSGAKTVASKRLLPDLIIQIVPGGPKTDVGGWVSNADNKGKKPPGAVRDIQTLADEIARARGPGIVMMSDRSAMMSFPASVDVQITDFMSASAAGIGSGGLRADAEWAMVVGRPWPSDRKILEYLCSQPPEEWPPSVFRHDGLGFYRSTPVYTKRNGEVHDLASPDWRWTGSDEPTDAALNALIAAPVVRLAEWLARDGGTGKLLVIVDRHPLVHRSSPFDGVPCDDVLTHEQAVPPAGWLLTKTRGMNQKDAAKALDVTLRTVERDVATGSKCRSEIALRRYF
jgi:hypothetical protein